MRRSADQLEELLDPGFAEIGKSGRLWSRAEMIAALVADADPEQHTINVSDMTGRTLAPGFVLLTYVGQVEGRRARRSSLWHHDKGAVHDLETGTDPGQIVSPNPRRCVDEGGLRSLPATPSALTAAAKQAAKERRTLEKKAVAAEHAANVSAGWPKSWTPAHVRAWTTAGGVLKSERRFASSGWDPGDVLELLDYPEIELDQAPPEGDAAEHRTCSVSLASLLLLRQEWPATPANTIVALQRTLQSGRRQLWTISEVADRLRLRQLSDSLTGAWRIVRDEDAGTDIPGAICATRALRAVRRGTINEYTASRFPPASLLSLLRVSTAGGDEDGEGLPRHLAENWSESDCRVSKIIGPALALNRWCTINDDRLVALRVGKKIVSVLVDLAAEEWLEGCGDRSV